MKTHLLRILALTVVILLVMPYLTFGQPTLGSTKTFVLFSGVGAVSNAGAGSNTLLTGNVGSNGATVSTNFGNVDGVMHDNDGIAGSGTASTDLISVRDQIIALGTGTVIPHIVGFGGGENLPAGVYTVGAASTLTGNLTLTGTSTDIFVFIIDGAFSVATNAKILLTGGATACNVFWQVNGLIDMATGADMKGTFIAKSGAIIMNGVTLEGRALALTGAITVTGITARIPIGCGGTNPSPVLSGPAAPALNSTECYVYLSGNGNVTGTVPSANFSGDIGTNVGLTTGFTLANVTGIVHGSPDPSTATATGDLLSVYNYLNGLVPDITLLYPADFGKNLVLTPHIYIMNSAAVLTGKLYLNAQGNANAVFVISITGALSTAIGAEVVLQNGALAKNVYWRVKDGAVSIETTNIFKGTLVANAGAIDLKGGATLAGRALTLTGTITSAAASGIMPPGCMATTIPVSHSRDFTEPVLLYPNPFTTSATIIINDASVMNSYEMRIYNILGQQVMNTIITDQLTVLDAGNLPAGIYLYKLVGKNKIIKSGKLISKR